MLPEVGDTIYIPSSFYLSHGIDYFVGGKATVSEIEDSISGGEPAIYVITKENPGLKYNWEFLEKEQEKLKESFGENIAHGYPDYRKEFNEW